MVLITYVRYGRLQLVSNDLCCNSVLENADIRVNITKLGTKWLESDLRQYIPHDGISTYTVIIIRRW